MKYILKGELKTTTNGIPSTVIIEIHYKTLEEAEEAKFQRRDSYINLKIIEQKT